MTQVLSYSILALGAIDQYIIKSVETGNKERILITAFFNKHLPFHELIQVLVTFPQ